MTVTSGDPSNKLPGNLSDKPSVNLSDKPSVNTSDDPPRNPSQKPSVNLSNKPSANHSNNHVINPPNKPPGNHSHNPTGKEETPDAYSSGGAADPRSGSEKWHPAVRDWNICAGSVSAMLILLLAILFNTDVFHNVVLNIFFTSFVFFLAYISGYFLYRKRYLHGFTAGFFSKKHNSRIFIETLENSLPDAIEKIDGRAITGHSFGLLTHIRTLKLKTGEIISVNEVHISSGFILGLYILIKASNDSLAREIVELSLKNNP